MCHLHIVCASGSIVQLHTRYASGSIVQLHRGWRFEGKIRMKHPMKMLLNDCMGVRDVMPAGLFYIFIANMTV